MLDSELVRLSHALELSEQRRRTAERTLAAVATDAAGKLLAVQAQRDEAIAERDELRRALDARPRALPVLRSDELRVMPRGRAWRALVVFALIVGILVVIDGVMATVWREPISALVADLEQGPISNELKSLDTQYAGAELRGAKLHIPKPVLQYRLAARLLRSARPGHALARIRIPLIGANFKVIEGTSTDDLIKGPGHYRGTELPGLPGSFGIAGHRTTWLAPFRNLDQLHHGSRIIVSMPYGRFVYRVVDMRTTTPGNASSLAHRHGQERLVLTACDPPGSAANRLVVTARLV